MNSVSKSCSERARCQMIIYKIKSALILSSVSVTESAQRRSSSAYVCLSRLSHIEPDIAPSKVGWHSNFGFRAFSATAQRPSANISHVRAISPWISKDTDCAHLWAACHRRTRSVFPTIFAPFPPFPVKVSALYSQRRKSVDFEIDRPCCDRMSGDEIPARWSMGSLGAIAPKSTTLLSEAIDKSDETSGNAPSRKDNAGDMSKKREAAH